MFRTLDVSKSNQKITHMGSQSLVFYSGQKMALITFYFIDVQRHILTGIESNKTFEKRLFLIKQKMFAMGKNHVCILFHLEELFFKLLQVLFENIFFPKRTSSV